MVTDLSKPPEHNEPLEFEFDNKTTEVEINLQRSMLEKLARAVDKEMNSKTSSKTHVTSIVKKELAIFEVQGNRGAYFGSCYENFNSMSL
jgi:hypothetical protein